MGIQNHETMSFTVPISVFILEGTHNETLETTKLNTHLCVVLFTEAAVKTQHTYPFSVGEGIAQSRFSKNECQHPDYFVFISGRGRLRIPSHENKF